MRCIGLLICVLVCPVLLFSQTISPIGPTNICAGNSITITISGAPGGSTFVWQKDGVPMPTAIAASYAATTAGSYEVVVTTGGTPVTYGPTTVVVNAKPNPTFSFTNNNTCSGTTIQFTSAISTGTAPYSYSWSFGDATTSTSQNPTHIFTALGCTGTSLFAPALTVTDANGCSAAATNSITVIKAPDVQLADQNAVDNFKNCDHSPTAANPNYILTVTNISPSASCITSYSIDWGDGSSIVTGLTGASFPLTHTYTQLGAFNLVVTGQSSSCSSTKTYIVANQSNPAGALGTLGSTTGLCAPASVSFTIDNWQLNSPGTKYILDYGDGKKDTLNHPLNGGLTTETVNHIYTTSSCPTPTYTATLKVINACDQTPYSAGNIQIRIKPVASFTSVTSGCAGQTINFTNTTTQGYFGGSCATLTTYGWDFGDISSGVSNTSTSTNPGHIFSSPGTYTVTVTATNGCGTSSATGQVCVVSAPLPSFTIDNATGCSPLAVTATNTSNTLTSCGSTTYQWTVTYASGFCGTSSLWSFAGGSTASSVNPSFTFTNPGTYTIRLTITNACGTVNTTKSVVIKKPPVISLSTISNVCGAIALTPTASVTNCGTAALTYSWAFTGGNITTSAIANPGAISFTTLGTNTIALTVTNECGSSSAGQSFTISQPPDVTVPSNQVVCAGKATSSLSFSGSISGTTFSWTNNTSSIGLATSGTGTIQSFTPVNAGSTPIVATITVTPVHGCNGTPSSFTITINPKPAAPAVISPLTYCQNSTAVPLTATLTGTALTWYTSPPPAASVSVPTPSTTSAGTTNYYVTQDNSFLCTSNASTITVNVTALITNNTIAANQILCSGVVAAATLTGTTPGGGTSAYAYQWQSSPDGTAWSNITSATGTSYSPGVVSATTLYRRNITSGGCSQVSSANTVTITILPALNNTGIAADQDICIGNPTALITGQLPTGGSGGYTYVWESSPDNSTWTPISGAVASDYQPPVLTVTTYYRRKISAGACNATSGSVKMTVNPNPVAGTLSPSPVNACLGSNISISSSGTTGIIKKWQYNFTPANSATWVDTAVTNSSISFNNVLTNFGVRLIVKQSGSCVKEDTSAYTQVTVSSSTVAGTTASDATVCTGGNNGTITLSGQTGSVIRWETSVNSGSSWVTVSNTTTSVNYLNLTTTTWYRAIVQSGACAQAISTITKITVVPTVTLSSAGSDQILCNQTTVTLNGNAPSIGTGNWSQTAGPAAIIVNPALRNTQVTGLQASQVYKFAWTITGVGSCPSSADEVQVTNPPSITQALTGANITICDFTTKDSVSLTGNIPANPVFETGTWSFILTNPVGSSPVIRNTSNPVSKFIFDKAGIYTLVWTITNGGCTSTKDTLIVTIYDKPVSGPLTGSITETCIGNNYSISTGSTLRGIILKWQYSFTPAISSSWNDTLVSNNTLNFTSVQKNFGVRVITGQSGGCASQDTSAYATLVVSPKSIGGTLTGTTTVCTGTNGAVISLSGQTGTIIRWERSINNGSSWTNVVNTGSTLTYSNLTTTTWYRVLIQSGSCTSVYSDTAMINVVTQVTAAAGADKLLCNQVSIVLNGNSPLVGTATWTQVSGPATIILTPNQASTTVNGLQSGQTYKFLWSLGGNSSCPATSDEIQIINTPAITQADAGNNQTICTFVAPLDSISLNGKLLTNPSFETGIWNFLLPNPAGSNPVIRNNNNPVSTFLFDKAGTYQLAWTISNNACTATKDTVVITVYDKPFAGPLIASSTTACIGNDITISSGNLLKGRIMKWQYSYAPSNPLAWLDTLITSSSFSFKNVLQSFGARIIVESTGGPLACSLKDTSAVSIDVIPDFNNIIDTTSLAICSGQTVNINGQIPSGAKGVFAYQWQQSKDGIAWTDLIGQTGVSLAITPLATTYLRRVVIVTPCFKLSNAVYVFVRPAVGNFLMSDSVGTCFPFTVTFTNLVLPSTLTTWSFGDGAFNQGDEITHTYHSTGSFEVKMSAQYPGGCKFEAIKTVLVNGPKGILKYDHATICVNQPVYFEVAAVGVDSVRWNFGDGQSIVTTAKSIFHSYKQAGPYTPYIDLLAGPTGNCRTRINGPDTIFVDLVKAGFRQSGIQSCAITQIAFTDTARAFYGIRSRSWNFGDGDISSEKNPVHNYIATNSWNVRQVVTGNSGCADTTTVLLPVTVWDIPQINNNKDTATCVGQTVNYAASVFSTDAIKSTIWNFSNGPGATTLSYPKVYTFAGNYLASFVATTVNGCSDTVFLPIVVYPKLEIDLGPDKTLATGTELKLFTTVTNGPAIKWEWIPATDLTCASCFEPTATIKNNITYRAKATTAWGCVATDTIAVKVFCENTQVYIPNIFTPDGDGVNDILMVRGSGIRIVKNFRIFNRWGQVVFEKSNFAPNDKNSGWNGNMPAQEKNQGVAKSDVYVYTCEVECENGVAFTYKGNITLIK